jgi:hypothetical protein
VLDTPERLHRSEQHLDAIKLALTHRAVVPSTTRLRPYLAKRPH